MIVFHTTDLLCLKRRYYTYPPWGDSPHTAFGQDTIDFLWEHHDKVLCSPFLDQVVPIWLFDLVGADNVTMLEDNRIEQHRFQWEKHSMDPKLARKFCDRFMVAHQVRAGTRMHMA